MGLTAAALRVQLTHRHSNPATLLADLGCVLRVAVPHLQLEPVRLLFPVHDAQRFPLHDFNSRRVQVSSGRTQRERVGTTQKVVCRPVGFCR